MNQRIKSLHSLFHLGLSIHHLNQKSEKQAGLSLGQWCLLSHLIDMPATSAFALAKAVGVHPSTLTQTLKRLESRKFLFISEDPKDSRKKLIAMTRQGKEALERADEVFGQHADRLSEMDSEVTRLRERLTSQIAAL